MRQILDTSNFWTSSIAVLVILLCAAGSLGWQHSAQRQNAVDQEVRRAEAILIALGSRIETSDLAELQGALPADVSLTTTHIQTDADLPLDYNPAMVETLFDGRVTHHTSGDTVKVYAPLHDGAGRITGVAEVRIGLEPALQTIRQQLMRGAAWSLVSATLLVALLTFLTRRIENSLRRLTQDAARIARGDVERPVPPARAVELRPLSGELDRMRRRLVNVVRDSRNKQAELHEKLARILSNRPDRARAHRQAVLRDVDGLKAVIQAAARQANWPVWDLTVDTVSVVGPPADLPDLAPGMQVTIDVSCKNGDITVQRAAAEPRVTLTDGRQVLPLRLLDPLTPDDLPSDVARVLNTRRALRVQPAPHEIETALIVGRSRTRCRPLDLSIGGIAIEALLPPSLLSAWGTHGRVELTICGNEPMVLQAVIRSVVVSDGITRIGMQWEQDQPDLDRKLAAIFAYVHEKHQEIEQRLAI